MIDDLRHCTRRIGDSTRVFEPRAIFRTRIASVTSAGAPPSTQRNRPAPSGQVAMSMRKGRRSRQLGAKTPVPGRDAWCDARARSGHEGGEARHPVLRRELHAGGVVAEFEHDPTGGIYREALECDGRACPCPEREAGRAAPACCAGRPSSPADGAGSARAIACTHARARPAFSAVPNGRCIRMSLKGSHPDDSPRSIAHAILVRKC